MNKSLYQMKDRLRASNINLATPATKNEIEFFQLSNGLILPDDIIKYFIELNGSSDQYDDSFFKFYSLSQFIRVKDELFEWKGIPDYRNLVNTMTFHHNCFVFSDYDCHSFTYAIQLYSEKTDINEVYVLTGDKYKAIASSLSEFIGLYLNGSLELYFND